MHVFTIKIRPPVIHGTFGTRSGFVSDFAAAARCLWSEGRLLAESLFGERFLAQSLAESRGDFGRRHSGPGFIDVDGEPCAIRNLSGYSGVVEAALVDGGVD